MGLKHQNIEDSSIDKSQVQLTQAEGDAVSIQNSSGNQVIINKIYLRLFGNSESADVDWDWVIKLLKKEQLPEIRKRLTDTLGRDRIPMDVSIKEQTNCVNRAPLTADRTLQIDGEDYDILDANKMLIETFGRDDIEGKILILGAPGAGKTTALLRLAEQLVFGAISQPKTVIPVIFELSTWKNDQDIKAWLIEQLYDQYRGDRRSNIYEQWLEKRVLLPLMDGLDELGLEQQKKCTKKLNEFAEHYPHLVVCCRINQFETVDIKLRNLRGAVCLQPLSDSQIQNYLDSLNRPKLWDAIQTTPSLQSMLRPSTDGDPGLLRAPLFVKLVADVYKPQQPITSKADLLDKYIDQQLSIDKRGFDRRKDLKKFKWAYKTVNNEPDCEKARSHLRWLARNLQANNKINFLIEHLQPSSIKSKLHCYAWLFWLMFFILSCLMIIIGLVFREMFNLIIETTPREMFNLESSFVFMVIFGFSRQNVRYFRGNEQTSWLISESYKIRKIEAVEGFQLPSRENVFKQIRTVFSTKALVSVVIIFLVAWTCDVSISKYKVSSSIIAVTILNLIVYLINLTKQELKLNNREKANQGIYNSFYSYIVFSVIIYVVDVFFGSQFPLIFLPIALLLSFFVGGGKAWLQHLCLRIVLWQSGLPLDFPQFLNYCVERRLLLRVGGSYRFLHRELLDHFVQSNH
jgi:NACHT domain